MKINKILFITLLVSFNLWAQPNLESDLESGVTSNEPINILSLHNPIFTQSQTGPLALEDIQTMYDLLVEIGEGELIDRTLSELNLKSVNDLSLVVQVCEMKEDHVLGTYQRGSTLTYKRMKHAFDTVYNSQWGEDILSTLEESYRHQYLESEVFYSLVVEKWPTICLRENQTVANGTLTFVHELIHYLGDDKSEIDLLEFPSQKEYVNQILKKSGGEFEAYYQEALVAQKMSEYFQSQFLPRLLSIYEDEEALSDYILNVLDYNSKFVGQYQDEILNFHQKALQDREYLDRIYKTYDENYKIFENNLSNELNFRKNLLDNQNIYLKNIEIIKESIQYGGMYGKADLLEQETRLEENKARVEVSYQNEKRYTEQKDFYKRMIDLTYKTLEEQASTLENYENLFVKKEESNEDDSKEEIIEISSELPIHSEDDEPTSLESPDHQTENDHLSQDPADNESEPILHP